MGEMIKMVVVLTLLSSLSGGLLAYVKDTTREQITNQVLQFVKGPTIKGLFQGAENVPIDDRFSITHDKTPIDFFVARFNGESTTVAFETPGKGFGGDMGLMVAVDVKTDKIYGIGVTTHTETAGIGAQAKEDPAFAAQFKGMSLLSPVNITSDGGKINALSGATITSRAVCASTNRAGRIYNELKPQIEEKLKAFTQ